MLSSVCLCLGVCIHVHTPHIIHICILKETNGERCGVMENVGNPLISDLSGCDRQQHKIINLCGIRNSITRDQKNDTTADKSYLADLNYRAWAAWAKPHARATVSFLLIEKRVSGLFFREWNYKTQDSRLKKKIVARYPCWISSDWVRSSVGNSA